jgi:hypothetical protein
MMRLIQFRASFTALLGILGVLLVLAPLLASHTGLRFLLEIVTFVAVSGIVLKMGPSRRIGVCVVAAGIVGIAMTVMRLLDPSAFWISAGQVGSIGFILLVAGSITYAVWTERAVTADTILGGIAVYLLLAVAWSMAYQALEFAVPGSFAVTSGAEGRWGPWEPSPGVYPRLFFFSFVTITTLGYGDLVPASIVAAGMTSSEAIVGPLYLTILIARLVGLHLAGTDLGAGESEPRG